MTEIFPTIPGYRIIKQMGAGGMATVYLAEQESFGREVALKIMSDQLGKDDVWAKRFMHEARIVSRLSHSNIVPVFDVGNHEGRFYISMELLKGGKLADRMEQGISAADAVRIVCGVAAGLDYAGEKGFVHRDIKPDNIMFRDDGTPVILDFGIAKQKDGESKMTQTGTIVGTTGYMSPEQAMGQELDERSDIYSLGVMFYELLTGQVPFRGDSAVAVLLKHVQEAPPPLPSHFSAFQPALDKALAKKPEQRYRRASEMIEHLRELESQFKQGVTQPRQSAVVTAGPQDATAVTQAIKPAAKSSKQPIVITVAVLAVVIIAGALVFGLKKKPSVDSANQPAAAVLPASAVSTPEPPPVAQNDNRAAIDRILQSAEKCLQEKKYDCAISKAESALDLDPANARAQDIKSTASNAQQKAFEGDWDAK